ncbi:type VI secretion protein [Streptomyces sp. NRRL F-5755]|uniref:type IV secretory system conjugative DNA transfer family protein n=1 Tax=Streptomyces sp. NRRL F-5755 TaxID=1519475 RepID=UPI0006ADD115|nr:type IV secretory system conjugative DNA transfer family protein [Streptomyces sp. NRRL F-5755]KOU01766.1 type VI secretion protein [Streptomyces sp. NRRL F-5755]
MRQEQGPGGTGGSGGGRGRGVPDSLLIGVLVFLLGLTVLAWTATGLAGLFTHGAWPDGVTFTRTPLALRSLIAAPHDLPAAWPDTPATQLSGYGLFWGILISELLVLVVLTVFALGTIARYRVVRANRRAESGGWEGGAGRTRGTEDVVRGGAAPAGGSEAAVAPSVVPASGPSVPAPSTSVPAASPPAPTPATAAPTPTPAAGPETPSVAPSAPAPAPGLTPAPAPAPVPAPVGPIAPAVHYGTDRREAAALASAAIAAAEGPLVVATTDPALWADTKDARAKLGPLLTYDPQHLLDTPARLRWSPTSGCEDIGVAAARAAALITPVRPSSVLDSAVADSATTLLRCWLHAAAVDGRPFRQLHRWAHTSGAAHEPVRVLRTNRKASAGQAGELESVLTAHAERREMAQELVSRTLACLSSIHIRDACNPARSDALLLESFIDEGGTLYVAGESIEDPRTAPGAMPLLIALLSNVVERGRRMAERSSAGRLDPPLTLVLHDIAALAPFPALPGLLETGREQGLLTLVTLRSQEQARARWPHHALPD